MFLISLVIWLISLSEFATLWDENKEGRLVMTLKASEEKSPGSSIGTLNVTMITNTLMYAYLALHAFSLAGPMAILWFMYSAFMWGDSYKTNLHMRQVILNTEIKTYEVEMPFSSMVIQGLYYFLSMYVLILPLIHR